MQFFTGGIISGLMGAIQYYLCVNFAAMSLKHNVSEAHTCHEMGPGTAGEFLIEFVGFVMQIVLVWIAFLLLPYSEKKGEFKFQYLTEEEVLFVFETFVSLQFGDNGNQCVDSLLFFLIIFFFSKFIVFMILNFKKKKNSMKIFRGSMTFILTNFFFFFFRLNLRKKQ